MKKQQKIIELRTAAKLKVAKIETKIAFARSEAAGKRARLLRERAAELDGFEAGGTERYDVLAKYRAKLADVNEQLISTIAQMQREILHIKSECERQCAAAEDDPEPEKELQQDKVNCDGSEHTARIVARRLINKMPHITRGGSLSVSVLRQDDGEFFVSVNQIGKQSNTFITGIFSKSDSENKESDFVEKARKLFAEESESGNSHVAEPLSRALDAIFGGNPVKEIDNLISDTVKDRKEGGNE